MAKKAEKAVKDLAKEVKKLRKENEKLGKSLQKIRQDQDESRREILVAIRDGFAARETATDGAEDHPHDVNGGFVTAESSEDGDIPEASADVQQGHQEEPEVTDAARRRAKELGVDPADVEGTGSEGRVLVKDVEAAAGQ